MTPEQKARKKITHRAWAIKNAIHRREYHRTRRRADPAGHASAAAQWRKERPEMETIIAKRSREKDPARYRVWQTKSRLKQLYGITPERLAQMKVEQSNRCAICRREPQNLHIDHDHATGRVRGLLCFRCNTSLWLIDSGYLDATVAYLRKAELLLNECEERQAKR